MRILIVSQYFFPESFRVNDIAFHLKELGHEVTVLTSKPNYPEGKYFKGYGFWKKNRETIEGISVVRVPTIRRFNGGTIGIMLNYISFLYFSYFVALFRIKDNHDIIVGVQLTPATSLMPMVWIKNRLQIPVILWVLDLWPESYHANSSIRLNFVNRWIDKISGEIYDSADTILVSSNYFKGPIKERIEGLKRFVFFPNWAEDMFYKVQKVRESEMYSYPSGYNVVFTGNIGESQGFEDILGAAKFTAGEKINWIIIGDGRKRDWVLDKVEEDKLTNVFLPGSFPIETMPHYLSRADSLLITLKKDDVFANTLPGKLQPYLTAGKPILGNISGEGKRIIEENNLGLATEPGQPLRLAELARTLSKLTHAKKEEIRSNCLELSDGVFSKRNVMKTLMEEIYKLR